MGLSLNEIKKLCYSLYDYSNCDYDSYHTMISDVLSDELGMEPDDLGYARREDLLLRFAEGYLETDFSEYYDDVESSINAYADILFEDEKIKDIIERRNITQLFHFTRSDNLDSILTHGLIPVKSHQAFGIKSRRNDFQRMDKKLGCTSISVSFPNYKLLYKYRNEYPDAIWVVLELNPSLLYSPVNTSYFFAENAAVQGNSAQEENYFAEDFEKMFCEKYIKSVTFVVDRSKSSGYKNWITTNPQAEILVSGVIPRYYIKKVHFCTRNEANKCINEATIDYDYEITEGLFDRRFDWKLWRYCEWHKRCFLFQLLKTMLCFVKKLLTIRTFLGLRLLKSKNL